MVRKFLDDINFGPMDSGKATVIADSQISKIFTLHEGYIPPFFSKEKQGTFQKYFRRRLWKNVQGGRGRNINGLGRGRGNVSLCFPNQIFKVVHSFLMGNTPRGNYLP